ncbi:MAG: cytochrome c, partial [Gemmatimonadota bacterium]
MVATRLVRVQRLSPVRVPPHVRNSLVIACMAPLLAAALIPHTVIAQQGHGEEIFQRLCVACHTVGGGDLIGPDLRGVEGRRTEEWIIRFVQHSQQMVTEGDSTAVALFERYQRIPMPDQPLTDDEIRAVVEFAASGQSEGPAALAAATPEQVQLGQDLFQGTVRFANSGPTCNSCHDVANDAVIGGGVLAAELTTVFTRLGGPGVRAIIGSPPFPVMQRAYLDRPLTEE